MSREILYKKEVGGSVKIDVSPKQEVAKADSLVDWLKTHELINISALCREAGINRSNFDKSLKMGLISPKQEAVLSKILKKYGTTGINPFIRTDGYYADLTEIPDLSTALQTVKQAELAFSSLPSQVRERFGNNPELMISFLQDEKNTEEGIKLGLIKKPELPPEPIKVIIDNPVIESPKS